MRTILLDRTTWDWVLDATGNIAIADAPYSLAQDAASAIRLFIGELYYNTTLGVPYFEQIYGQTPPLSLMKSHFVQAAMRVPGVVRAQCYITEWEGRTVRGQVQVWDTEGMMSAANF